MTPDTPSPKIPLVSVAIPSYCGAKTIEASIESVLRQTLEDLELIIVDDGSSDDTAAIIARYKDPRIRFYRNAQNLGPAANWNRCLSLARGKYFKLLPQDDVLRSDCLENQATILEDDPGEEVSLVFCARTIIGSDGKTWMRRGWGGQSRGRLKPQTLACRCIRHGTNLIGEPGAVLFRRSVVALVGNFDARTPYVIDLDYWLRLLAHGQAYYDPDTLVSFRVTRQSWSYAIRKRQKSDFLEMARRLSSLEYLRPTAFDWLGARFMTTLNAFLRSIIYRFMAK